MLNDIQPVILAAGRSQRMGGDRPKPLHHWKGKPLISYPIRLCRALKLPSPILVIRESFHDLFKDTIGEQRYVYQAEPKGTADAVSAALPAAGEAHYLLILQADDSMKYRPATIRRFMNDALKAEACCAAITLEHPNPPLGGRIERNRRGQFKALLYNRAVLERNFQGQEIVAGVYLLKRDWTERALPDLPLHPKSGEYYLPDLIPAAHRADCLQLWRLTNLEEWASVNRPEDLQQL